MKGIVEALRLELRAFRDENGNELLGVPEAPLPPAAAPAPLRFVPDYDTLILSHADRRRVISDEHRKKLLLFVAWVRTTFSWEMVSQAVRARSRKRRGRRPL